MALETTLILFKPDAIEKHLTGKVLGRFEEAGFTVRGIKMMQLDDTILREHYSHVADKPFFPEIVAFMSRTPVIALALEGANAGGLPLLAGRPVCPAGVECSDAFGAATLAVEVTD